MKVTAAIKPFIVAKTLKDLPFGEPFYFNSTVRMKVKPTGFLLNSSLVGDVLNRADCFVIDVEKGTLYVMLGSTPSDKHLTATLVVEEE